MLRDAGLVVLQTGAAGGARLARGAEMISLLDVFGSVLPQVERAMEAELAKISIREVARRVVQAT